MAAPTDIQLSADTFDENASFAATLTTTDADSSTFIYSIVDDPSISFQISGDQLELISPLDFENLPAGFTDNGDGTASVDVTLRTTDESNNTYDEIVTLTVNNVDETGTVVAAINAGGGSYTATDGTVFSADTNFTGGKTFSTSDAIANTEDDAFYQTERYAADLGYDIAVADGDYEVTLHFAELFFTSENQRVFDILLEGTEVEPDLDIYAVAGHDAALALTFTTTVADGNLDIDFLTDVDNAKLSALVVRTVDGGGGSGQAPTDIQLSADTFDENASFAATLTTTDADSSTFIYSIVDDPSISFQISGDQLELISPLDFENLPAGFTDNGDGTASVDVTLRTTDESNNTYDEIVTLTVNNVDETGTVVAAINAGGGSYTATDGTVFSADTNFTGGKTFSTSDAIANTEDDAFYQTERYAADLGYDIAVADGDYEVTLHFAELFFTSENQRVFDILLEGTEVEPDLDIYAVAGHDAALALTFTTTVADGNLDIDFLTDVDNAKLSALVVRTVDGGGGSGQAPTDIQLSADTFDENASFAATLTTTDANSSTFIYSIVDDPSISFQISGDQLELISPLDFENLPAGFTDNGDGTASVDVTLRTTDESNNTYDEIVTLTVNNVDETGTVVAAINAGGGSYTATDGTVFSADTNFTGGKTFSTSDAIANTEDDAFYQTERYAADLGYDIAVADGDYEVTLHFAELFFTSENQRVFDILLEGTEVEPDLDIYAVAGHDAALALTFTTTVADGNLDIDFLTDVDNAKLSALVVRTVDGGGGSGQAPTDIQLSADTFDENASFAATLTTTDADSSTFIYSIVDDPSISFQISGDQLELISPLDFENLPAGFTDNGDGTASVDVTLRTTDESNNTYDEIVTLTVNNVDETGTVVAAINAGGGSYTATDGTVFSADTNFTGGKTFSTSDAIANTEDDAFYQTERYAADLGYDIAVADGDYEVTLHFAELFFTSENQRVFDILLEGTEVEPDLDIYAVAGHDAALALTFTTTVADGNLDIDFLTDVDNAKLSALVVRTVDGGGGSGQAPTDIQLSADTFDENASFAATLTTTDADSSTFIYSIVDDPSISFQISGDQLELISPLDFENLPAGFTDNGDGTASVDVTLRTTDESNNTYDEIVTLTVNNVDETGTVVAAINAGGGSYTATDGTVFSADTNFTGGKTFSTSDAIANTEDDAFYQTERYAADLGYDIAVADGDYEVTLHFAELFFTSENQRVFDILLEGTEVEPDLDIYAVAGHDAALALTFTTTVADGNLDIDFLTDVDNAKLSALVVRTVDGGGGSGQAPTDIQLSADTFDENASFAATLTTTDANSSTFIYSIVDDPSISFQISGDQLELISPLDFENLPAGFTDNGDGTASVDVTLRTTDESNNTYDEIVTLTVNNVTVSAKAYLLVTPSGGIDASTFDTNSFQVTNTSENGEKIESITIDLSSAILPGLVFDPEGLAGDTTGKPFNADSGSSETGFTGHTLANGSDENGWRQLTIFFSDFDSGETFGFSIDVDPDSIKGLSPPGPNESGSVSGLELSGSTLSVAYSGLTSDTNKLFGIDGSTSGSEVTVTGDPAPAPSVSLTNLPGPTSSTSEPNQTLVIAGPAGATVRILVAEGGGFTEPSTLGTLDTYEANSVVNVQHLEVVLDQDGTATLPITLTTSGPQGGLNHITAAVVQADGTLGAVTPPLVVEYNKAALPSSPTVAINAGGGSFTASDGTGYDADSFFSGGNTFSTTNSISGTIDDQLYQSERFGQMSYAIPLAAGEYFVTLQFAEIGFDTVDARVFDVLIENSLTINDLDIFSLTGSNSALDVTVPISLTDDTLNLDFQAVVENPKISAIRVASADASGSGLAPTNLYVADTSFSEDVQFSTVLGANDNDSDTLTFLLSDDPSGQFIVANNQLFTTQPIDFEALPSGFTDNGDGTASIDLTLMAIDESNNAFSKTVAVTVNDDVSDNQVAFQFTTLDGEVNFAPTSIQFGPDGRLYVSDVTGTIHVYEITVSETDGQFTYSVVATETIDLVAQILNHDDDGSENTSVTGRQVTGIVVTGDASNPVIYVSSSDPRIGGAGNGGDQNLDTNSGVISRLTWNGTNWEKVDIVRGLPRSEENHATNGLQYDSLTNTLYVAQGGNTNAGAPSNNFAFLNEFALSGAVLTVDLDAIEAIAIQTDSHGQDYIYDLPTVNDPTVDDSAEDTSHPWGGNDGMNMAMLVPDSPVQIYSPGFRNIYDIVLTADGKIYTIDNGANTGWGGLPFNEGSDGTATNQYDSSEPGSTEPTADGEEVDDADALHLIASAGYYGGHPNPLRANPDGAGLYTFGVFEDSSGNPIGVWSEQGGTGQFDLPSTWLPVDPSLANPIEGNFIAPTSSESTALAVLGQSSINGIVEYLATSFNGALVNDLLTVDFGGDDLLRITLNSDGTQVVSVEELASNFAVEPLDVTATSDGGPFPGTIWVASLDGSITVFTPTDAPLPSNDPNADDDGDGYANQDELDNGTDPLNPASQPPDFDGDLVSDLNDDDDDNDTIVDLNDSFARDGDNGVDNVIGPGDIFRLEFDAIDSNGGFFDSGMTGLMTNGVTDYLDQYDPDNILAGGATSAFAVQQTTTGDATNNNQDNGFQFGASIDSTVTSFVFETVVTNPFQATTPTASQSAGIQVGTGDQDNYVKFVLSANDGAGGLLMLSESDGITSSTVYEGLVVPDLLTAAEVRLLIEIDVTAGEATPAWEYTTSGGITESGVGDPMAVSGTTLDAINGTYSIDGVDSGFAFGIINTHLGAIDPIKANYDYLEIWDGTLSDALIA